MNSPAWMPAPPNPWPVPTVNSPGCLIAAYHRARNDNEPKCLFPRLRPRHQPCQCRHGQLIIVPVATDPDSNVDLTDFKAKLSPDIAAVMLTCPSTLGLFEQHVVEMATISPTPVGLLRRSQPQRPHGAPAPAISASTSSTSTYTKPSPPHGGRPGSGTVGIKSALLLPPHACSGEKWQQLHPRHQPSPIDRPHRPLRQLRCYHRAYAYMLHLGGNTCAKLPITPYSTPTTRVKLQEPSTSLPPYLMRGAPLRRTSG